MADTKKKISDEEIMSPEDFAQTQKYAELWDSYTASGDRQSADAVHGEAEKLRAKYNYSGGDDGTRHIAIDSGSDFSYDSAPAYVSQRQSLIDSLSKQYLDREPFSYDAETDPLYAQLSEQYGRNGRMAMEDTLGKVSARTGGLASSYAGTAAQQAYGGYMQQLSDRIPELQQLAYSMYQDENNARLGDIQLLNSLEQNDYSQYQDRLGQYNADRSFERQTNADNAQTAQLALENDRYGKEWDYQQSRDALSDARYNKEWEYQMWQDAYDRQQDAQRAQYSQGDVLAALDKIKAGKADGDDSNAVIGSGYEQELTTEQLDGLYRSINPDYAAMARTMEANVADGLGADGMVTLIDEWERRGVINELQAELLSQVALSKLEAGA